MMVHSFPLNLKQQTVSILARTVDLHLFNPGGNQREGTPFQHCNYVHLLATYRGNKMDESVSDSKITRVMVRDGCRNEVVMVRMG